MSMLNKLLKLKAMSGDDDQFPAITTSELYKIYKDYLQARNSMDKEELTKAKTNLINALMGVPKPVLRRLEEEGLFGDDDYGVISRMLSHSYGRTDDDALHLTQSYETYLDLLEDAKEAYSTGIVSDRLNDWLDDYGEDSNSDFHQRVRAGDKQAIKELAAVITSQRSAIEEEMEDRRSVARMHIDDKLREYSPYELRTQNPDKRKNWRKFLESTGERNIDQIMSTPAGETSYDVIGFSEDIMAPEDAQEVKRDLIQKARRLDQIFAYRKKQGLPTPSINIYDTILEEMETFEREHGHTMHAYDRYTSDDNTPSHQLLIEQADRFLLNPDATFGNWSQKRYQDAEASHGELPYRKRLFGGSPGATKHYLERYGSDPMLREYYNLSPADSAEMLEEELARKELRERTYDQAPANNTGISIPDDSDQDEDDFVTIDLSTLSDDDMDKLLLPGSENIPSSSKSLYFVKSLIKSSNLRSTTKSFLLEILK